MWLVLLTTAGNQGFIFASNRLREAVGASELVRAATTTKVEEACAAVTGANSGNRADLLQASSGSALVVADGEDGGLAAAREVVWLVTRAALVDAPGLDMFGTSIPIRGPLPTREEVSRLFAAASPARSIRPSAAVRFPRLPIVASCASTDLPAASWRSDAPADRFGQPVPGEDPAPMSAEVIAKRKARPAAERRMGDLLEGDRLIDIDEFFDAVEWVGVVHADGNGLGGLFQRAPEILGDAAKVAELSRQVQIAADQAFKAAVKEVPPAPPGDKRGGSRLLVPLVVGGDDLTVLVDGAFAIRFAWAYLAKFGEATAERDLIRETNEGRGLTAAAGIAVVKPHFPFSAAYELADELCRNAKDERGDLPDATSVHALDVHVLFDSVVSSLDALRARLEVTPAAGVQGPLLLHERPFFVPTDGAGLPSRWRHRGIAEVAARAAVVRRCAAGRSDAVVTRTQLHALRDELGRDVGRAERRFADLWQRAARDGSAADSKALWTLAGMPGPPPRLVRRPDGDEGPCSTAVVDALELADLIGDFEVRA